jgi:hypothetical protein
MDSPENSCCVADLYPIKEGNVHVHSASQFGAITEQTEQGAFFMIRRRLTAGLFLGACLAVSSLGTQFVQAAPPGQPTNWQRFYYYPYVYYPHNFAQIPESYDHLYYRYPTQRRIPVYNADWYNFYPSEKPYHWGTHYIMDVF